LVDLAAPLIGTVLMLQIFEALPLSDGPQPVARPTA
jgi:hypothetical protein